MNPLRLTIRLILLPAALSALLTGCTLSPFSFIADSAEESPTYADLVDRLTDMERLAALPHPAEICAQASSYDRASQYDPATGEYLNWAHNGDGAGIIRMEGDQAVIAELQGPGVIWRFWMAHAAAGPIRIYLDGNPEPALDLPAEAYFSGQNAPFNHPGLVYIAGGGKNAYIPIPFQESCKITAGPDWGAYYEFTYTTFPPDTRLPAFTDALSPEGAAALERASQRLLNAGDTAPGPYPDEQSISRAEVIQPGQSVSLAELSGPRAITSLRIQPALADPLAAPERLRELVLRITFDDHPAPAVLAPLGDFFGTAPGVNLYKSWPMGMTETGYYSYWYMPFAEKANIEIFNDGPQPQALELQLRHAALSRPIDQLARFNVIWHDGLAPDPARAIDWFFLRTQGRGRFCGLALHVWNPQGGWWGEGDEKFYVDGENFPSTYGTGSEDYFGYAWCDSTLFARPFHNQTRSVPENPCANPTREASGGWTSNNRWQIADNVPFHQSFVASIEKYMPDSRPTRYQATVYWYSDRFDADRPALPPLKHRLFDREESEIACLDFLDVLAAVTPQTPIAPLRETFARLSTEPVIPALDDTMTLRMAAAEAIAGDPARARALFEPIHEITSDPFILRENGQIIQTILGAQPALAEGIHPYLVPSGDGSTHRVLKQGRAAIASDRRNGRFYIYFAFPDGLGLRETDQTYRLQIDYYSEADSDAGLTLEYDSHFSDDVPGIYRTVAVPPPSPGAGWKTAEIELPRARFTGRQNSGADFRITSAGDHNIFIGNVLLKSGSQK